jgi:hypothetical protein
MVFFGVMTAWFFINNAEKERLRGELQAKETQIQQLNKSNRTLTTERAELQELIAGPSAAQWAGTAAILGDDLKGKAEKAINAALQEKGEAPPRNYTYLTEPYKDIESLFLWYREARDTAHNARAADNDALVKAKAAADEAIAKLREEHQTSLQRITELEARVEDLDNQGKQEKAGFVRDIEQLKRENSDRTITMTRELNRKDTEIGSLKRRIEDLLSEANKAKTIEDIEPDGRILNLSGLAGKGWIDLGRVNHLRKGLVFRVFQYVKGGKKAYKGRAEVIKVDETVSEVRILEEDDALNPISNGDYIFSPFYDPEAQPVFVFGGTGLAAKDVTKEYLVMKMKDYGAVVKDKVDLYTDYLVALTDYESSPEYKAARELNVTVIRERDLLEFIGR